MNNQVYHLLALFVLIFTLGCNGCKDEMMGEPQGNECTSSCPGGMNCENGFCKCQPWDTELRPGFCVLTRFAHTFVTYDTYGTCIDTTLIGFDEDPYLQPEWQPGENDYRFIAGYPYNQNSQLGGLSYSASFGLKRPEDEAVNIDSVYIIPIFGVEGTLDYDGYCEIGGWSCLMIFYGRFIDANTIVGEARYTNCIKRGRPQPEGIYDISFPMTWHRLEL